MNNNLSSYSARVPFPLRKACKQPKREPNKARMRSIPTTGSSSTRPAANVTNRETNQGLLPVFFLSCQLT